MKRLVVLWKLCNKLILVIRFIIFIINKLKYEFDKKLLYIKAHIFIGGNEYNLLGNQILNQKLQILNQKLELLKQT